MASPAIEISELTKTYRGGIQAVRGVSLDIDAGQVFSLLGPNGAGKTTVVEICEGHRRRTSGEVRVLGFDPGRGGTDFKRRIGIVLQTTGVEPYLTVSETVELFSGYYPSPRPVDEVIEAVGLRDQRSTRVKKLSGGQQRRLDVAVGLAGDPNLLFLDEPTTGFDPSARRDAWEMIRNLKALGKTIFLTTHYMDEASALADRVAIIVQGQIVADGTPEILTGRDGRTRISFRSEHPELPPIDGEVVRGEGKTQVSTEQPTKALHVLTKWALENGSELHELSVTRASLEDVYLELTRSASRDTAADPSTDAET